MNIVDMKKSFFTIALVLMFSIVYGQNWGEIKANKSEYFSIEGSADTKIQAVKKTDKGLLDIVSKSLYMEFQLTGDEQKALASEGENEINEYKRKKIESYNLTKSFHTLEIQDEPTFIIGRYISKNEVDEMFAKRSVAIRRYVKEAIDAERERNLSVALRYFYWSYMLTKTLKNPNNMTYSDNVGNKFQLINWLPDKINALCEGINVTVVERNENNATLKFTTNGQDVSAIDFRFKVGSSWSSLYSAKDGQGEIEMPANYKENDLKIRFEYRYEAESEHLDETIFDIFSFVVGSAPITGGAKNVGLQSSPDNTSSYVKKESSKDISHLEELRETENQKYKKTIDAVVSAIKTKNGTGIDKYFTPEGYEIYQKLIEYGSAKVKDYSELSFTRMGGDVIVRSIPMSFTFKNGSVRTFVEDVVFTLNSVGKISNISFGLGKEATRAIMARDKWGDTIQQQVINFLEVYKTAYALKRYEYLETLFADNAVIIVGRVVMQASKYPDADRYGAHKIVIKTRYTKAKYMEHVKKCFDSNEFINIRFARTSVTKKNREQIFGIQLKQYYNSSNYGDEGYLFLQVDMRNPSEPVIMVRTWQEDYDPEVGRPYGMQDF